MKSCFRQWSFFSASLSLSQLHWFTLQMRSETFFGSCRWPFCQIIQRWKCFNCSTGQTKKKKRLFQKFQNEWSAGTEHTFDGLLSIGRWTQSYGRKNANNNNNNNRCNTSVSLNGAIKKRNEKRRCRLHGTFNIGEQVHFDVLCAIQKVFIAYSTNSHSHKIIHHK